MKRYTSVFAEKNKLKETDFRITEKKIKEGMDDLLNNIKHNPGENYVVNIFCARIKEIAGQALKDHNFEDEGKVVRSLERYWKW